MNSAERQSVLVLTSSANASPTNPELALCRFLQERCDLQPLFVCPQEGTLSRGLRALGAEVKVLRHIRRWRNLKARLLFPWIMRDLQRFVSGQRVALVHAARLSVTPFAVKIARRLKIPCISHIHGVPTDSNKFRRYLVHQANVVIGVCDAALTHYKTAPGQEVRVVHNGLDTEAFLARAGESDAGCSLGLRDYLVIGMSGAYPLKGVDVFVEAAAMVGERFSQARFIILGAFRDAGFEKRMERRVRALGLSRHLFFVGFQENVAPYIAATEVWTIPSRVDAAPMIALEAMALGKPVVGSRVGGIPELVCDGETGSIVPAGDAGALAGAICDLLADPVKRNSLGEAGRKRVEKEFSFDRFCGEMKKIYDWLIGGSRQ